jgi:antitoxin (DNA-binding transcriptional repressor) of toxin-antitoxin stability system
MIMETVNIHDAKTRLSQLIADAVKGKAFIIAKAGKPLVKVERIDAPAAPLPQRMGFMAGQGKVPDDFDGIGRSEIRALFDGASG